MKIFRQSLCLMLCISLLLSVVACKRKQPDNGGGSGGNGGSTEEVLKNISDYIVQESNISYMLQYDEQAPFINDDGYAAFFDPDGVNRSWENWSLPIGNGYFGVSLYGRTESERIQIADKTLSNPWQAQIPEENWPQWGGLNSFAETYLDFDHTYSKVSNYNRYLDLNSAISGVSYTYQGVNYTREYFASYPDNALVIRLDANESGQIDFVLRPTVPYEQEYAVLPKDEFGKYGEVVSSVSDGVGRITLSGKMTYYDIDFISYYDVYTDGGTVTATQCMNANGELDGTITVSGANSAYIIVTLTSDYELDPDTFTSNQWNEDNYTYQQSSKPTAYKTLEDAREKLDGYVGAINAGIAGKSYEEAYTYLKERHINDYSNLFGRVSLDLGFAKQDMNMSTDDLLYKYRSGSGSTYFEALLMQYGRYLLIASSREGTLPAHLQGAWNVYNMPAWSCGYWNNENIQMNYWSAFSTNLLETFESYSDFLLTYIDEAQNLANKVIQNYNSGVYGEDGGNGWVLGTASNAHFITEDRSCGNLGYTTQLFWDYYQFTKDPEILEMVYEIIVDAARFITKCVKEYDGKYLVEHSDSPEMWVDDVWYYTVGTTYAQTFAYLNNYYALELAKEMGIDLTDTNLLSQEDKTILKTVMEQIDKYDPINVGLSGQVKEFREEDYYGSLGYDPYHRHISQLVGLFPGNLINANTEAWLDAAMVTMLGRTEGMHDWDQAYEVGWSWAHKASLFARLGEGDKAQEMLLGLSSGATMENLMMAAHGVLQFDASSGTTAAIAEMLLQSQDGYIIPLAAIPANWQIGSYTGLVARGNFEISVAWQDGVATSLNILSNKGEKAFVKYPSITEAKVYTSSGKSVGYEIVGNDTISFDTVAGETYVIFGLEKVNTPDKVNALNYEVIAYGDYHFTWEKVNGAASYNLYVAYENDAKYTFIGNVKDNSFIYSVPNGKENVRKTFCITAVNSEGRESRRTLSYYNPVDTTPTINDVSVSVLNDSKLQVIVQASESVAKYVLWEKAQGHTGYVKVAESIYPTIIGNVYNTSSQYAVTAISVDGGVSEMYLLSNRYDVNNILLNKQFVPTQEAQNAIYDANCDYVNLTDGVNYGEYSGRYSSKDGSGFMDATVDLGASYILDEIRIYDYKQDVAFMGTVLEIYVKSNNEWTKVVSVTNAEMSAYRRTDSAVSGTGWLAFELNGVKAEKIRISVPACTSSTKSISIYEIQCSGVLNPELDGDIINNLFTGKAFVPTAEAAKYATNVGLGYHCLTDGLHYREGIGRFSTVVENSIVDATIDLGAVYQLRDIQFYVFKKNLGECGSAMEIQAYYDGEWKTVVDISNADYSKYVKADDYGHYLDIDLEYVLAEKIRVYIPSPSSSGYITFYEVECSGVYVREQDENENVFADKQFVPTQEALDKVQPNWAGGGYEALTDGVRQEDVNGRFLTVSGLNGIVDATLNLGAIYDLYELKVYLYDGWQGVQYFSAGKDLLVEAYYGGQWNTVVYCADNDAIASHVVDPSTAWQDAYLLFNLDGVKAEKVRIYISGSAHEDGITLQEITCSGAKSEGINTPDAIQDVDATVENGTATGAVSNVFDGNKDTYLEVSDTDGDYSVVVDLGYVRTLYTLRIYEIADANNLVGGVLSTASNNTKIEIFVDGYWMTVFANEQLTANGYTTFNFNGLRCSKVRITFNNTRSFDGESSPRCAKISEIEFTAQTDVDRRALLTALNSLGFEQAQRSAYLYDQTYLKYADALTDYSLTQEKMEQLIREITG